MERVMAALERIGASGGAKAAQPTEATERVVLRAATTQAEATVTIWRVPPDQEVKAHRHPAGQDTWVVLAGEADYYLGSADTTRIHSGDVAVAAPGEVHGCLNGGDTDFVFVSVLAPATAGFEAVTTGTTA